MKTIMWKAILTHQRGKVRQEPRVTGPADWGRGPGHRAVVGAHPVQVLESRHQHHPIILVRICQHTRAFLITVNCHCGQEEWKRWWWQGHISVCWWGRGSLPRGGRRRNELHWTPRPESREQIWVWGDGEEERPQPSRPGSSKMWQASGRTAVI